MCKLSESDLYLRLLWSGCVSSKPNPSEVTWRSVAHERRGVSMWFALQEPFPSTAVAVAVAVAAATAATPVPLVALKWGLARG